MKKRKWQKRSLKKTQVRMNKVSTYIFFQNWKKEFVGILDRMMKKRRRRRPKKIRERRKRSQMFQRKRRKNKNQPKRKKRNQVLLKGRKKQKNYQLEILIQWK